MDLVQACVSPVQDAYPRVAGGPLVLAVWRGSGVSAARRDSTAPQHRDAVLWLRLQVCHALRWVPAPGYTHRNRRRDGVRNNGIFRNRRDASANFFYLPSGFIRHVLCGLLHVPRGLGVLAGGHGFVHDHIHVRQRRTRADAARAPGGKGSVHLLYIGRGVSVERLQAQHILGARAPALRSRPAGERRREPFERFNYLR